MVIAVMLIRIHGVHKRKEELDRLYRSPELYPPTKEELEKLASEKGERPLYSLKEEMNIREDKKGWKTFAKMPPEVVEKVYAADKRNIYLRSRQAMLDKLREEKTLREAGASWKRYKPGLKRDEQDLYAPTEEELAKIESERGKRPLDSLKKEMDMRELKKAWHKFAKMRPEAVEKLYAADRRDAYLRHRQPMMDKLRQDRERRLRDALKTKQEAGARFDRERGKQDTTEFEWRKEKLHT